METATLPISSTRFGPATAPKVVDTIATLTAVARWSTGARSVPAYLACRLVDVPAP